MRPSPQSFFFLSFSLKLLIKKFNTVKAYMINYIYIDYQVNFFFLNQTYFATK